MEREVKTVKARAGAKPPAAKSARPRAAVDKRTTEQRLADAQAQQAATSEILRAIAESPTNVVPVLDTVAHRAADLCRATHARVLLIEGDHLRSQAYFSTDGEFPPQVDILPLQPTSISGRAVIERKTIHHADVVPLLKRLYPAAIDNVTGGKMRAVLAVPMFHHDEALGTIFLWRREPGLFAPDQVALVETFATQAAIAIANVRLFHATQEALEQQTATGEILRVISRSPTDAQPVFETIAANALRLCDARRAAIFRFDGELIHIATVLNLNPESTEALRSAYPAPPSRGSPTRRAILTASTVHIPNVRNDPEYRHPDVARVADFHSVLSVPMLRDGRPIGAITVYRDVASPFPDRQIDLLKTFAEQAVIAIENVRLFTELDARNRDLTETLEQQTATSEILRVISSSPTDVQPVFETIAANALRLCDGEYSALFRFDGEQIHIGAFQKMNPDVDAAFRSAYPSPPSRGGATQRAILTRQISHIPDINADPEYTYHRVADRAEFRSALSVPMLRNGEPIGTITVYRAAAGPFPDSQIELLKTFADQAVIAVENVRLFNETKEALDRQTATADILKVISSSPTDTQPIFEEIVESAMRLCDPVYSAAVRLEGGLIHLVAHRNWSGEGLAMARRLFPMPPEQDHLAAIAIRESRIIHLHNLQTEPDVPASSRELAIAQGYQTLLIVPMLREARAIGAIIVANAESPFSDKHVQLLQTFADQAVIAVENVRLFTELESRNRDLTEALEQQTATGEVLRVISQSQTNVQPIFDAISKAARKLCVATSSNVFTFDGEMVHVGAVTSDSPHFLDALNKFFPRPPSRATGVLRAILTCSVVTIEDVLDDPDYMIGEHSAAGGFRSVLAVPLMREGRAIGAISVGRTQPGPFPDSQVELLKTFADQAVIAIENVRLFKELEARNADLTEALEQQTATSEILRVINQSLADVQPVFETISAAARKLCGGSSANVFIYDGKLLHLAALSQVNAQGAEAVRRAYPRPVGRDNAGSRAVSTCSVVMIPDILDDPDYGIAPTALAAGFRSILAVPLMRERSPIGAIAVGRPEPGPFPDSQVDLLKTFADQAVIAIENVRLFKELETRTKALTRSVGELKALGDVGQAVSSTLDLETVLSTIVSRATQLAGMDGGSIYEYDESDGGFYLRAADRLPDDVVAALRATPIRKGEGALGQMAVTREPVQIRDVMDAGHYQSRVREKLVRLGLRSMVVVPLLRDDHLLGGLAVNRKSTGEFDADVIQLLKTFATQSALAIQNARLFREIEVKSRQLEIASQHKSEFLANMSHELRTPLNAIIGFSEVLSERLFGEMNDKQAEYVGDITDSGRHLLHLINDILDLSKIEAGRMELDVSEFALAAAIESMLTLVRERAQRRAIALGFTTDDEAATVSADERKVKQVLLNLLSNALKFTPEGGKVDVTARTHDDRIEVSVTDTGVGIAANELETVFEEFRQVGAAAKKIEGTGLGLAISRKFIELHGGKIWVTSQPGAGSTFAFTLPRG